MGAKVSQQYCKLGDCRVEGGRSGGGDNGRQAGEEL